MKVIRKSVIDIETGKVIKSDDYEYKGPIAKLCGGGGGGEGGTGPSSPDTAGPTGDANASPSAPGPSTSDSAGPNAPGIGVSDASSPDTAGPTGDANASPSTSDSAGTGPSGPDVAGVSFGGPAAAAAEAATHGGVSFGGPEAAAAEAATHGEVSFGGPEAAATESNAPSVNTVDTPAPFSSSNLRNIAMTVMPLSPMLGITTLAISSLVGLAEDFAPQLGVTSSPPAPAGGGKADLDEIKPKVVEKPKPSPKETDTIPSLQDKVDYNESSKAGENERRKSLQRAGRMSMRLTNQDDIGNPFIYIPSLTKLL